MSLQDLQNATNSFDQASSYDDFLEQMINCLQSGVSWPESTGGGGGVGQNKSTLPWDVDQFDDEQSAFLATKFRQHQISSGTGAGDSGLFHNSIETLFNGFVGSLESNQTPEFRYPPAQRFESPVTKAALSNHGPTTGGATATGGGGNGPPVQPRQRVRARRGQATDPHSIAERLRRERIAERMKSLQELIPNANKTDKASMLDEIIDYVKFLQLQVKVLSMSRLGGAATPVVADISSEGGRDCLQVGGSALGRQMISNQRTSSSNNDTMTVAENRVVKLMEEDMGSAMQYLQGKGLCLMPISLATAISTSTSHPSPEVVSVKDSTSVFKP